jgi:amino-acid N-acetyltransferase
VGDPVEGWTIRNATTGDMPAVARLLQPEIVVGRILNKRLVDLYEHVQEFRVAVADDEVVGCGALHVFWEDLAEVRSVATAPGWRRRGVARELVTSLVRVAVDLGVRRIFTLTYETEFFASVGFVPTEGVPVTGAVRAEMLASTDEGVAEFLDLDRVKPNTLGNTRMLLSVPAGSQPP